MGHKEKHGENNPFSLIADTNSAENGFSEKFGRFQSFNALTPEEIEAPSAGIAETKSTGALEALKKRMLEARMGDDTVFEASGEKSPAPQGNPVPQIKSENSVPAKPAEVNCPEAEEPTPDGKTLLERCRPFITEPDGSATAMDEEPSYRLESIADILSSESKKALERLSEKYDLEIEDFGKSAAPADNPEADTPEPEIFEETLPLSAEKTAKYIISDIDSTFDTVPPVSEAGTDISSTATIKFTPVSDSESRSRISISSMTQSVDLSNELNSADNTVEDGADRETRLEQTEFEEFEPQEEFDSGQKAKYFLRRLSVKKRGSFLRCCGTVFITLILAIAALPSMSAFLLEHTAVTMTACTALLAVILLLNYDMFAAIPKIFTGYASPDTLALTALLSVILYSAVGIAENEITVNMLLLAAFTASVRSVSAFMRCSHTLTGFKQISTGSTKRAIKLIDDPAVTFAMSRGAVQGDVLAAAPRRTSHIDGFMKYTSFRITFGGKLPIITAVSLLLSVILGFACAAYFDGMLYGFYTAAAIQCLAATPVIFLTDDLPLYGAARRLGKRGAMIAGKMGAEYLEKANAVVFGGNELFPSGTVTLHNMQVLSDNSIDDTLIRAAALTDSLSSPLAPIFKKIAGTSGNPVLPDSDTVKYEDKMGISGWVDNRLLFVGNRTLMEAHGITVPSIETDRKLLRRGYFPVYVASGDKACALLAVQYSVNAELAYELRRISALGITMLIESSDPNLTEEMICDYMGLYDDSVKVMSAAGCHMYRNAVTYTEHCRAPAAYKGNPSALAAAVSCASRIKKAGLLFSVLYSLAAVLGTVVFTYMSFGGSGSVFGSGALLLYGIISTFVSLFAYLTCRP